MRCGTCRRWLCACDDGEKLALRLAEDWQREEDAHAVTKLERDRYRTALETIAESCNTIESATEVAREALKGGTK